MRGNNNTAPFMPMQATYSTAGPRAPFVNQMLRVNLRVFFAGKRRIPYLLGMPRVLDYPPTQGLDFPHVRQLSEVLRFDYLHRGARLVLLSRKERKNKKKKSA